MTIRAVERERIILEGPCPSEEAEVLLQRLLTAPAAVIDLRTCESLHTAVLQVVLAAERILQLPALEEPTGRWLHALLSPAKSD